MNRLAVGMIVYTIRGRRIGRVTQIGTCCFTVRTIERSLELTPGSIGSVADNSVTLTCDGWDFRQFACPQHSFR